MKTVSRILVLPLLVGCVYFLVGCDGNSAGSFQSLLAQLSGSSFDGRDSQSDTSVADVSSGLNSQSTNAIFSDGASRARVRNESENLADITLYFYSDDSVVHSAFIRILPDMVTTVASLRKVDSVELTGEDVTGRILKGRTYFFGVDFDAFIPAEYVIRADGRVELVSPLPGPPPSSPGPTLQMLEPSSDIELSIGSTLKVRWTDDGWDADTLIQIFLQPVGSTSSSNLIPMGVPIGAALDGINDENLIVLEQLALGDYRVMVRSSQTSSPIQAVAPGVVHLVVDSTNTAPELNILSPLSRVELHISDTLEVTWEDYDADDNATITFGLESVASSGMSSGKFTISNPIAEDPDGSVSDSARFTIHEVLPGLYDLVGTIDDGKSTGTSRVRAVVLVRPEPQNDPPTLELIQPANDIHVRLDESFVIRWVDSDENDNARISFMLDPDVGNIQLNGNEIVLISSILEDDDGPHDQLSLGLPDGIKQQSYRLLGVIIDGQVEVVTSAPGRVIVIDSGDDPSGGGDNPGGNNDDGNGGDETLPDLPIVDVGDIDSLDRIAITNYLVQLTFRFVDFPDRITISNVLSGGSLEIDLLSDQWNVTQESGLMLLIPANLVSVDVYPRTFDVIVEYISEDGRRTIISDSPIYIP